MLRLRPEDWILGHDEDPSLTEGACSSGTVVNTQPLGPGTRQSSPVNSPT